MGYPVLGGEALHNVFSVLSAMGRVWLDAMISPFFVALYSGVLVFIILQYRRNRPGHLYVVSALLSILWGLAGGFMGSILLMITGVDLYRIGIAPLWFLALILAILIHPRFICFAYAGGIISIYTLIHPHYGICIPQLLGMVAILHLVESFLIRLDGSLFPSRAEVGARGETRPAYHLQKFWPLLLVMGSSAPSAIIEGGKMMPHWWPLLQCYPFGIHPSPLGLLPILAILGYGDTASINTPLEQARRSAWRLFCYSAILLVLALMIPSHPWLAWVASLYAPLGHELIIWMGSRQRILTWTHPRKY